MEGYSALNASLNRLVLMKITRTISMKMALSCQREEVLQSKTSQFYSSLKSARLLRILQSLLLALAGRQHIASLRILPGCLSTTLLR